MTEKKEEEDVNLVTWNGPDDPENPQNYSTPYKFFITGIWIYGNLCATLASSIWSSGSTQIKAQFHQSTIVVTLGISLFLLVSISNPIGVLVKAHLTRRFQLTRDRGFPSVLRYGDLRQNVSVASGP